MPVDLTRFDFHVIRFMNSYDVEMMTNSEIGQYILLLCKAWLLQKDATLPDDPVYLAFTAKTDKVSERVLAKFPLVETQWGTMRQNAALFEEWCRASGRSDSGKERAEKRWGKDSTPVLISDATAYADGNATASKLVMPKPNQTVSNQINSNQTTVTPESGYSKGEWENIRNIYRRIFNKKPDKNLFQFKYMEACTKWGEDVVLKCFEEWADSAVDWAKREDVKHPLYAFFKKIQELAEEEIQVRKEVQKEAEQQSVIEEQQKKEAAVIETNVAIQAKADFEFMNKAPAPEPGASALDYLAELPTE